MIIKKPFYFLRHGETKANADGLFCGSYDCPLSTLGEKQAAEISHHLLNIQHTIQYAFFSPLRRAKSTAVIATESISPLLIQKEGLKECDLGRLEKQKMTSESQKIIQKWLKGEESHKGESHACFSKRIKTTFNECLQACDSTPLFVSHGGVFMTLISNYLGHTPLKLANCGLVYLEPTLGEEKWKITPISKNSFL